MSLDGTLMFGTEIDNSGFENGLNTLKQIGNTALGMLAADIAKQIGNIAAQIPAQILNVGSGFEASMSQVAATMGITSEAAEFEILSAAASEMGETTKFSASQAAEALNYLALAGYDAEKSVSALPSLNPFGVIAAGAIAAATAFSIYVQNMDMTVEVSEAVTAIDNETNALKRQREANEIDDNYEKALKLEEGDFKAEEWNSIKLQIIEAEKQLTEYQETIKKFEGLSAEKISPNSGIKEYADDTSSDIEDAGEKIILTQEEVNDKLKTEWDNLNHAYAMGVIVSDEELYARKSALLKQYGNENLSEHWKYYEELYGYQQEFAEKSKKASEDAAKETADICEQEWDNIFRLSEVGLITEEDAYRKRLKWIQKYCPEYADEWYSYYKTIIDYQREAMTEQVEGVKSGLSKTLNEYKKAYSELESYINNYKNRLLSVGSTFSIEESDGNKYYNVESQRKQIEQMKKYHDYVKQLKERGMSQDVLGEMTSYDFDDGMFFAENLAKMSDSELKEISKLYEEKKQLAEDLSNELYAPEMEKLNTDLVNGVISEFGTLPDDIKEIGAAALEAFIDGISETENLSEKVSDFTDSFFTACNDGIENGIAGLNLTDSVAAAFDEQDTYAIGKEKGNELVSGFNDALNDLYSQIENEKILVELQAAADFQQADMAEAYGRQYQYQVPNSYSESDRRVIIENHVNTTVQLDKDVVGKSAYEYSKEYDRRAGK